MLERLGSLFSRGARRLLPDPMVIACGLTLLVIFGAITFPQHPELIEKTIAERVPDVARIWFAGLWNPDFLVFALQMCVVLLTGYGLAKAPPAMALLRKIASHVHTNRSAVLCVTLASCLGCWINWGFGLIAGGILAGELRRSLIRKRVSCHYALIVAGAYAGMMIWHGGLSGSAPLKIAGNGVTITRATAEGGVAVSLDPVDIRRTILSSGNLIMSLVLIVGIPLVLRSMVSTSEEPNIDSIPHDEGPTDVTIDSHMAKLPSIADRANRSRMVPLLIALLGIVALSDLLSEKGTGAIGLNFVNSVFLILGLLLHRNLREYIAAVTEGGRAVVGIVLQFPLYSGIQFVMKEAGLAMAMSQGFVDAASWLATAIHLSPGVTFPTATFFSAGLVNLFVPSGGGQWIVQGPIMCSAGDALKIPIEQTVMAISYGDQWTNMIQPFWAIPLMGLTGVNVRQFMGYCALLMILAMPVFVLGLVLLY